MTGMRRDDPREMGPLPEVADPARRARCTNDFRAFCETYFAHVFHEPWTVEQVDAIAEIEAAVLQGAFKRKRMPRAGGSTSLLGAAALWVMVNGHHPFTLLLGPRKENANGGIERVTDELMTNALLLADYPEACYPVRCAAGFRRGMKLNGEKIEVVFAYDRIVLAEVKGAACSRAALRGLSITGDLSNLCQRDALGHIVRPSLALVDGPHTFVSAGSPSQVAYRESLLNVLKNLPARGKLMAGVVFESAELAALADATRAEEARLREEAEKASEAPLTIKKG